MSHNAKGSTVVPYFTQDTFRFFDELAANNQRDWFNENKARYIEHVRDPFIAFIRDVDPRIKAQVSVHYGGDPRPNGGSLFRIYRDTRFSKDKTPYKTWAGARFTHSDRGRRGAPGFYLHLQPGNVFMGAGIWHPETAVLNTIRTFLHNNPTTWQRVLSEPVFRRRFKQGGSSLKRMPRGFEPDHPLAEDIKRKDFVIFCNMTETQALSSRFLSTFLKRCEEAGPFVDYLCAALDLEF